jgi:hypothetical protein
MLSYRCHCPPTYQDINHTSLLLTCILFKVFHGTSSVGVGLGASLEHLPECNQAAAAAATATAQNRWAGTTWVRQLCCEDSNITWDMQCLAD